MTRSERQRPSLAVIGPLPPPAHGVTISTSLVLANLHLRRRFHVTHVNTSDHRSGENIGRWDVQNIASALLGLLRLVTVLLSKPRGLLYLPLSANRSGYFRDSLFILIAKLFRWKVVVHMRGSDFPIVYQRLDPAFKAWIRVTLRFVDSCGVMGESLRGVFLDLVPPSKVEVVPNGTPQPMVLADPASSDTVVFLSDLRARKGVEPAVEAARLTLTELPDVRFRFVGPWESEDFERYVRDLAGADPRIEFDAAGVAGIEKDELLASAALLLFPPPEPEGHPRVVLEAVASGLPVVATDRGAIADTVADGKTGYVLPEPDPQRLAERIIKLMRDPRARAVMGAAARERYEHRHTQDLADRAITNWLERVWSER